MWLAEEGALLTRNLAPHEVVVECWPVVGARWRSELLGLGHALGRGRRALEDYLRHERIYEEAIADAAEFFELDGWEDAAIGNPPPPQAAPLAPSSPRGQRAAALDAEGHWSPHRLEPAALREAVASSRLPAALPPLPPSRAVPALGGGGRPVPATGPGVEVAAGVSSSGNQEFAREIGHLGELFAFRALQELLPGFDEDCWVSSSRTLLGLRDGDDTLGYDFAYMDVTGQLCGESGRVCLIDVKANAGAMSTRFSVSGNEWDIAEACSQSDDRAFVILRVFDVGSGQPQVGELLADPVGLALDGALQLSPKAGWWVDSRCVGGQSSPDRPDERPS